MKTNEQLIEIARAHTKDLPKLSGQSWATDETLNKVTVQDTVIVHFGSTQQHDKKVMILLERETGKFIADAAINHLRDGSHQNGE